MNCVHPVCRSNFSLLCGTASPAELIQAARQAGYRAAVMADRNNLYGCYDF